MQKPISEKIKKTKKKRQIQRKHEIQDISLHKKMKVPKSYAKTKDLQAKNTKEINS